MEGDDASAPGEQGDPPSPHVARAAATSEPSIDSASRARPSRRALLGMAGTAALVGAGAGAGVAALLRDDDDEPTPRVRLARGSVPGGDGGPWHLVAPGGSVQDAIDGGATAIVLGAGDYPVEAPIVPTAGCTIVGVGAATRLVAVADLPAVVAVGNGGPTANVTISDLTVDAAGRAAIGIDLAIVGVPGGEPDASCRLDDLWVFDAVDSGVVYRGRDTQACVTSRVRVRRAGRYGFRVEAPDNVWLACEATTKGAGGAGFYIGVPVPGSDAIGAANCHFHACKAWYCHGLGWQITSTRNTFVGCEAQDVAGHGWSVEIGRNLLSGCVADTAGMYDVGGRVGESDGFFVVPDDELSIVGCLSFDRGPGGHPAQQRHGFNVPKGLVERGLLSACTGWDNRGELVHERVS